MSSKTHWESIYSSKPTNDLSWFQEYPETSLRLIRNTGVPCSASVIDVGGGASTLVDALLLHGYSALTVLDLSGAALLAAKSRLGADAAKVQWLEADITATQLPAYNYDVWHDRAVFHFLTSRADREAYLEAVLRAVKPGGHVIIATFAEDGPTRCSDLPIVRYSAKELHAEFSSSFLLLHYEKEEHHTPRGTVQNFVYCCFRKAAS